MDEKIKFSRPVPPFVRYCAAIIPTMFDDSLSYYEALCALNRFIQTNVIEVINNNAVVTEDYAKNVKELQEYVEHYFDNLDVQEEINNKLDEMAESGQLSDLIAQYIGLGALVTFNTLGDLIESENVNVGTKCKTLGKDEINDGYGAIYTISESGEILLENGLYATLINDAGGNNYYNEISFTKERYYDTDCYFTTIPKFDSQSNEIPLYIGKAANAQESPEKYAQNNFTTFTCNATLNYGGTIGVGSLIRNGEIERNIDTTSLQSGYRYIGIKQNREIVDYQANETTASEMLANGCEMAWLVYFRLVQAGEAVNFENIEVGGDNIVFGRHPRQCLGQKTNGDIVIMTSGGRTINDQGLTAEECATLMINKGCTKAWNLDGGGSASTIIKGVKINRDIDSSRTADRFIEYTIDVKKTTIDKELAKIYSQIGSVKNNLSDDLMPLINYALKHVQTIEINGESLNDLTDELMVAEGYGLTNTPLSNVSAGYFINIPHAASEYIGLYSKQIFFVRDTNQVYVRSFVNGSFTPWYSINGNICHIFTNSSQTISATNTYEDLVFNTSMIADETNTNIFGLENPDNSGNSNRITVNATGKCGFRAYIVIEPAATRDIFLKFMVGSSEQAATRTKVHVTQGELIVVPIEYVRTSTIPTNTFGIQYYGQSGDKLTFKIYGEC